MSRLVSEPIKPLGGSFEPAAMARGEPGLPLGFEWRGRRVRIAGVKQAWRKLGPESGGKELYLRRHFFTLSMEDGATWTVYCLRQPPGRKQGGARWFLYTVEEGAGASGR